MLQDKEGLCLRPQEKGQGQDAGHRVHFRLPHTVILEPSPQQEEQLFYQRLESLLEAAGGGFKELFAATGWEDLIEDKGLRKWLVRHGQGEDSKPHPGQEVTVKLLGVLEDQSLVERDPKCTFVLGQGEAIEALELGVVSMQLGEVALFLVRPAHAYGPLGREPDIPKEATLLYEVSLLQVQESPDPTQLPLSECLSLSNQRREWGNFHFEREQYQRALRAYQLAFSVLPFPDSGCLSQEEAEQLREHRVKCLNNYAATQLKLHLPDAALASCDEVLQLDPSNTKALFRKGKLLSERGEDQLATAVLKRALQLEPTMKAVHAELSKLAKRQMVATLQCPSTEALLQEDTTAGVTPTHPSQTKASSARPS